MPPFTGARAGKRRACRTTRRPQARHQIAGQERAIARHARDVGDRRRMCGCPIEPGENTGERAGEIRHAVSHYGKTGIGEPRRIAIGVEDDGRALRLEAREHPLENGLAADLDARLVAATHAPRQPAREHEAENWRAKHGYDRPGRAAATFWIALLSICPTFAASAIATNPSRCVVPHPLL